jgi:NADH-quinone oxidoreductase subunit L
MPSWLPPLIPALPLLACVATAVLGARVLRQRSHVPCVAAVTLSFAFSLVYFFVVFASAESQAPAGRLYYDWIRVPLDAPLLQIGLALRVDSLSAVMLLVVTFVGMLVAVYSVGYMHDDPGYWRFFAEIALFIFSMTMLVLASNFLLLYIFWEAVGLCSYLLIGFWYQKPEAAAAGKKAFLVNRIGDLGFALGVFLIWVTFGSLDFDKVFNHEAIAAVPSSTLTLVCLLLFAGAVGKSAQFPLHVWLPDAMEGPTPVSALIHAATMVTAGVYMVARSMPLFAAAPAALATVAVIGAFTALLAALIALTQNDLKRVLAYSTVSQLGYMFMGLGIGSIAGVTAGMFHLFTHAFFKALLFLSAGSVMHAMGGVIDMTRFSGLRRRMPTTCWTFAVGAAALAGVPLLAGFWSKDAILAALRHSGTGAFQSLYYVIYWVGLTGAFLTAFYISRAFFKTFWGDEVVPDEAGEHARESPPVMTWPLVVLAAGSLIVGFAVGPTGLFRAFLARTPQLAPMAEHASAGHAEEWMLMLTSSIVALVGVALAYGMYAAPSRLPELFARLLRPFYQLSYNKFYLDEIYFRILVMPARLFAALCRAADRFLVDGLVDLVAAVPAAVGRFGQVMQNGLVQFYALAMLVGLVVLLVIMFKQAMG